MGERIRFHLDEHVDPVIAHALRRHGIDVTTTVEAGLRTQSDAAHIAFAQREGRVIVSHDDDFLRLASQYREHAGIAYCRNMTRSVSDIINSLILIYEVLTPEEMVGHVEYL